MKHDIKRIEKKYKVYKNVRHPHIRSWESMLAEIKNI
jgi:hypothetical protein